MRDLTSAINVSAARVAGIYLIAAAAWIVLTDQGALRFVFDPIALTGVQTAKGLFFVTASAGLLYVLIAREQRRLSVANEDLELTLRHASVLHRLLRHNVRNSCDVILNNVALLRRNQSEEDEAFDRIERQATSLVDIAEKCRHLRDLVLEPDTEQQPVDLAAVCRERAASVRSEFPDATVTTSLPDDATAMVHPRIGIAIDELLRNAILHTDHPDVTVAISGTVDADTVTIEVADDGPGLPEMELSALDGLFEEPLEHSRGIGLWLVQFLVAKSNGQLDTGNSALTDHPALADGSGAVVKMTFDRVE